MKEKKLVFAREKHMPYSKTVKTVMLKHLTAAYGTDGAEELLEKIRKTYVSFLKDMPFIGGRKNTQARGVYDSILSSCLSQSGQKSMNGNGWGITT